MEIISDGIILKVDRISTGNRTLGHKNYELTNHLGNVLTVVTDNISISTIDTIRSTVASASDYYPFGLQMPGRTVSDTVGYRYGFNGKERDPATEWGQTSYDYGFRIYNPSIGKFLSVDPLQKKYPDLSPYQYVANSPIIFVDPDGREIVWATDEISQKTKKAVLELVSKSELFAEVYRTLDGLERKISVETNPDKVKQAIIKATGDPNAEAEGYSSEQNSEIVFSTNTQVAFTEEFFHQYQYEIYGDKRDNTVPNLDAEAKVFNQAVAFESIGEGGTLSDKVKSGINNADEQYLSPDSPIYMNNGGTLLIFVNIENSLKIEEKTDRYNAWISWLNTFKENHNQIENDPYGKGNKLAAKPKAFNEVVDKIEKKK